MARAIGIYVELAGASLIEVIANKPTTRLSLDFQFWPGLVEKNVGRRLRLFHATKTCLPEEARQMAMLFI